MDFDLKTSLPTSITARKTALALDAAAGTVMVVAELHNSGDQELESLSASVAVLDECGDVRALAETATGPIPPDGCSLVNFVVPLAVPEFLKLDFRVEVGKPLQRP